MGRYSGLRVKIKGDDTFGVPAFSKYWSHEDKFGCDVDPDFFKEEIDGRNVSIGDNHLNDIVAVFTSGLQNYGKFNNERPLNQSQPTTEGVATSLKQFLKKLF